MRRKVLLDEKSIGSCCVAVCGGSSSKRNPLTEVMPRASRFPAGATAFQGFVFSGTVLSLPDAASGSMGQALHPLRR
jgi:hypothetical protein